MTVLHLFNEINFSGAEIMYGNAASSFQAEGCRMIAFSTGKRPGDYVEKFENEGIEVEHKPIYFSFFTLKAIKFYAEFYRYLKKKNISVLHIHRSDIYFASIIASLAGIPSIKTQHNTFKNRWFTLPFAIFQRWFIKSFFKVTFQTIGQSVYDNERTQYLNSTVRINNWFNEKKFYPKTSINEKIDIRLELGVSYDDFVIISTGSCSAIKNHADIIKALAIVNKSIKCIYIHLGHGALEGEEKELAQSLSILDNCRFLGNQSDVRRYLVAADLFVMTSKFEGLCIAGLEAMACELPAILYDAPGLRDLIVDDHTGQLISPEPERLADGILQFYANPDIVKEKGANALAFVKANFSLAANVPEVIKLYREVSS